MFILKFDNTTINNTNIINEISKTTYENRKIIAKGKTKHNTNVESAISWTFIPNKKDPTTFKPIAEKIILNDGSEIDATIFNITYTGNTSGSGAITSGRRSFYIRIIGAKAILGKSFITITEDHVDQEDGKATIEFLEEYNSHLLINESNNQFKIDDINNNAVTPLNITNKFFFINEELKQFNVITFYMFSTAQKTDFMAKYDYLKLKKNPENSDTTKPVGQENIPDKLSPTFQDFISIYQNMLRADPNAMLEDLQKQIDKEKEKRKKYEKILKEFIKYLGKYNTRINDHSDNMEKIINGNNS